MRKLPKVEHKHDIPILRSKEISAEVKRLLLKWYIGKFPIPQRGRSKSKQLTEELRKLAQYNEQLTKDEENRLNWLVPKLVKETARN